MQDYSIEKTLGEGSFGKVYLVYCDNSDVKYAVKTIDVRHGAKKDIEEAKKEGKLLASLDHENIVSYVQTFESDGYLCFVTEYCSAGDLEKYLLHSLNPDDYIEESQIFAWTIEITSALQYLHSRKIVHRDIKTANIYLTDNLTVKVGDLGVAKVFDMTMGKAVTVAGAPLYMAPEIFDGKPYSYKVDIWGLGCCVYEMAALERMIQGRSFGEVIVKVQKFKFTTLVLPDKYSRKLHSLLRGMLKKKPVNRLTADAVMEKLLSDIPDVSIDGTEQSSSQGGDETQNQLSAETIEKEQQRNTLARKRRRAKASTSASFDESEEDLIKQTSTITRQVSDEGFQDTTIKLPTRKSKNKKKEKEKLTKEHDDNDIKAKTDLSSSSKSNFSDDEVRGTVLEQSSEKNSKKLTKTGSRKEESSNSHLQETFDEWEDSTILQPVDKSSDKIERPEVRRRNSKDKPELRTDQKGRLKDSLLLYGNKGKDGTSLKSTSRSQSRNTEYSQSVSKTVLEIDGICERVFEKQDHLEESSHGNHRDYSDSPALETYGNNGSSSSDIYANTSADFSTPRTSSKGRIDIYDPSEQLLPYSLHPQNLSSPHDLSGSVSSTSSQEGTLSQQNSFGKRLESMEKEKFSNILSQFNSLMSSSMGSSRSGGLSADKIKMEKKQRTDDDDSEAVTLFTRGQTVSFKNTTEEEPIYENITGYNQDESSGSLGYPVGTSSSNPIGFEKFENDQTSHQDYHKNSIGFEGYGNDQPSSQDYRKNSVGFEGYGKVSSANASRFYHLQRKCVQSMGEDNFFVVYQLMSKTDDPKVLASLIKTQIGSQAYRDNFTTLQELRDLESKFS